MKGQGRLRIIAMCAGFVVLVNLLATEPQRTFGSPSTTWTVNSTADVDDGSCGGKSCTLREAINLSAGGDTINFDATIAGNTIYLGNKLIIDNDLIIDNQNKIK